MVTLIIKVTVLMGNMITKIRITTTITEKTTTTMATAQPLKTQTISNEEKRTLKCTEYLQ